MNVPKKFGPHGELFLFLLKKEPMVLTELVEFGPCVSAETVKACALIGLHMRVLKRMPFGRTVIVWTLETCGSLDARRVRFGAARVTKWKEVSFFLEVLRAQRR